MFRQRDTVMRYYQHIRRSLIKKNTFLRSSLWLIIIYVLRRRVRFTENIVTEKYNQNEYDKTLKSKP